MDINKLNKTICLNCQDDMRVICKYLSDDFGIDHFCYIKCYLDGTHFCLSTHNEWLEHFYAKHYDEYDIFHRTMDSYSSEVTLWSALPEQSSFQEFKEHSSIDYGIVIIDKGESSCEIYNFASNIHNPKIINFYLNNTWILWRHIYYFKDIASDLIQKAEKDRWLLPHCRPSDNHVIIISSDKVINNYKFPTIRRFYISPNEKTFLNHSEAKCCYFLVKGEKIKSIAQKLDLAPATVQNHINHAKEKLDCANNIQLAQFLKTKTNLLKINI